MVKLFFINTKNVLLTINSNYLKYQSISYILYVTIKTTKL